MNPREITRTNLAFENDLAILARHKPAGFFMGEGLSLRSDELQEEWMQ